MDEQNYAQPSLESITRMLQQLREEIGEFKVEALRQKPEDVDPEMVAEAPTSFGDDAMESMDELGEEVVAKTKGLFDESGEKVGQMTKAVIATNPEDEQMPEDKWNMIKKSIGRLR